MLMIQYTIQIKIRIVLDGLIKGLTDVVKCKGGRSIQTLDQRGVGMVLSNNGKK